MEQRKKGLIIFGQTVYWNKIKRFFFLDLCLHHLKSFCGKRFLSIKNGKPVFYEKGDSYQMLL